MEKKGVIKWPLFSPRKQKEIPHMKENIAMMEKKIVRMEKKSVLLSNIKALPADENQASS